MTGDASTSGVGRFDDPDFDITFDYPAVLARVGPVTADVSAGPEPVARAALVLDGRNGLFLMRYRLAREVSPQNLPLVKRELDTMIGRLGDGPVTGWPVTAGGLPGYEYRFAVGSTSSRYVVLFHGNAQYVVNAQATAELVDAVGRACDTVLATMALR